MYQTVQKSFEVQVLFVLKITIKEKLVNIDFKLEHNNGLCKSINHEHSVTCIAYHDK